LTTRPRASAPVVKAAAPRQRKGGAQLAVAAAPKSEEWSEF